MKRIKYIFTALLLWLGLPLMAQDTEHTTHSSTPAWYVGLQGGVPFGVSTFSAFGHDQVHGGFVGGIYGSYRFHPVVSLEAFAKWGTMALTAQACCVDNHLWLGADGIRYNVPVLDMEGWNYSDLHSQVFMQQYGLQVNINLLGCFAATRDSRWTLEVSPLLAAVITKAEVTTGEEAVSLMANGERLTAHLGAGGNVQVGFQASKHINVGIYSGITYLTGHSFDGMPDCPHRANYVWESGVRLACTFPHKAKNPVKSEAITAIEEATEIVEPAPAPQVEEETTVVEIIEETPIEDTAQIIQPIIADTIETETVVSTEETTHSFPMHTLFFTFNSTRIRHSQLASVEAVRDTMLADPTLEIVVEGYCDADGSEDANTNISTFRAQAVKDCLVSYGIAPERITVVGKGVDPEATSHEQARRADIIQKKEDAL